jgi:hypothetical protein
MTDRGIHDGLVWQALVRLPVPVEARVRQQLTDYLARVKTMADAQQRGVTAAPPYRRSLPERFEAEADRLSELDDPAAPVWRALAESARLAEEIWQLDPDNVE